MGQPLIIYATVVSASHSFALTSCVVATSLGASKVNVQVKDVTREGDNLTVFTLYIQYNESVVKPRAPREAVDSGTKFVQIEVAAVTNPRRYATFRFTHAPISESKYEITRRFILAVLASTPLTIPANS